MVRSGAAGSYSLDLTWRQREAGRGDMEWELDRVTVSFLLSITSGIELWEAWRAGINCKECSNGGQGPEGPEDGVLAR